MIRGKAILAGLLFPLLLLAVLWGLVIPHDGGGGLRVRAEFQNVGLLVPGEDVRTGGAIVGSVQDIVLTDHGTALATIRLEEGVPAPRADATASVRDSDLLGGNFLALDPGTAQTPLTGPIPTSRTFLATRVQDMFDSFSAPTRTALQTLIVQLGRALDARGLELNRAVLRLAPAFAAMRRINGQLASQQAQIDESVRNARQLTAQLAPRGRDVEQLISGMETSLQITARRAPELDGALQRLPSTMRQLRSTLRRLDTTASAATPLARELVAAAPGLTTAATRLAPFVRAARPALGTLRPLARDTRDALRAGERSLPRLRRAVGTLADVTPDLAAFTKVTEPLAPYLFKGAVGGLGRLAAETGEQQFSKQPGRNYFRGEAVLGCQTFGLEIRPGCLEDLLAARVRQARGRPPERRRPVQSPTGRVPAPLRVPRPDVPSVVPPVVDPVKDALDDLLDRVPRPTTGSARTDERVDQLLDFLLSP